MVRVTISISTDVANLDWHIDTLYAIMGKRKMLSHEIQACEFAHRVLVSAQLEIREHERRRRAGLHDLPTKIADALSKPPWSKPE